MDDGYGTGTRADAEYLLEEAQRWGALGGGSWLIARGLFRRSIVGIGMMFVGGLLLDRGLTGRWSTRKAAGHATGTRERAQRTPEHAPRTPEQAPRTPERAGERGEELAHAAESYDTVDESSAESFPASDSPSWTPDSHIGEPPPKRF